VNKKSKTKEKRACVFSGTGEMLFGCPRSFVELGEESFVDAMVIFMTRDFGFGCPGLFL
jgi:hypothetical protein